MQTEHQTAPTREIKKVLSSSSISTVISQALQTQESKKYTKITNQIKEAFLQLIINQNCSIKKAAEELNINYSSAKTIISLYREKNRKKFKGPSRFHKRAGYRETTQEESERTGYVIATSIGGIETSTRNVEFGRNKLIKKLRVVQIVRPELH